MKRLNTSLVALFLLAFLLSSNITKTRFTFIEHGYGPVTLTDTEIVTDSTSPSGNGVGSSDVKLIKNSNKTPTKLEV